jgi:uncharacterized protein (TIGR02147 family)
MAKTVFDYDNYREFLREKISDMRAQDESLSYRVLSKKIGFSSPNYILLVIDGKRNISVDAITKFSKFFDLKKNEADFFKNLVLMNQAQSVEDKLIFQDLIYKSLGYLKVRPIEYKQFQYFSHWALIAIREMVELRIFNEDPKWISKHVFKSEVSAEEVKEFIKTLLDLKLIEKDNKGQLRKVDRHITLPPNVSLGFIFKFHKMMLEKASEALFKQKSKKRDITSTTLPIKSSRIPEIKDFLEKMRQEFIVKFSAPQNGDTIYTLNTQLFELADLKSKEDANEK